MSTSWYGLHPPVTSIRVNPRDGGKAFDVLLWLKHQQSGRAIVMLDELKDFIDLFINYHRVIIFQEFGGPGIGKKTSWVGPREYSGQVISDYYEANLVSRDDYIMERAEHLWKPKPIIRDELLQKNNGGQ